MECDDCVFNNARNLSIYQIIFVVLVDTQLDNYSIYNCFPLMQFIGMF